jgi:hypothetical protein
MKKFVIGIAVLLFAGPAIAAQYQVTYSATDPTTYLPSDSPDYPASYRIGGGAAVDLLTTNTPAGTFSLTVDPGTLVELCLLSRNGVLVTPASCDGNWIAVGNSPVPPLTQPMGLTGFSATIIFIGP